MIVLTKSLSLSSDRFLNLNIIMFFHFLRFVDVGLPFSQANEVTLRYEICFAGLTDIVNRKITKGPFLTGTNNSRRMVRYFSGK